MNEIKDPDSIPTVPLAPQAPRFANPFQGLKGDPTAATVNCLMPKEAFVRVKQCRLEGGTIQTTMNLLWIKLINLLERKQIYGYESVREFEDAVQRSILILPEDLTAAIDASRGGPAPGPDPAANIGDVAGAVEPIRSAVTSESEQPDTTSNVSKGSKPGNKRGKKSSKDK